MKRSEYVLGSFLRALGVLIYVAAVAWLLSSGEAIFGGGKMLLIPVFMLLLLIISATITGLLVLGNPIHLYLSGLKKEALIFLCATLMWLAVFAAAVPVMLRIFYRI